MARLPLGISAAFLMASMAVSFRHVEALYLADNLLTASTAAWWSSVKSRLRIGLLLKLKIATLSPFDSILIKSTAALLAASMEVTPDLSLACMLPLVSIARITDMGSAVCETSRFCFSPMSLPSSFTSKLCADSPVMGFSLASVTVTYAFTRFAYCSGASETSM